MFYRKYIKRTIDFSLAIVTTVLFAPVLLGLYVLILLIDGFNPLFIQQRVGMGCRSFKIFKFRTMKNYKDADGMLIKEELRVTKFGRILRKSGLDELPQIINILKSEMSFVGPRPLPDYYIDFSDAIQVKRHEVLPGITGLAQVTGRNSLSWPQRYILDSYYIDQQSFFLDIKILIKTLYNAHGYDAINFKHVIPERRTD